MNDIEKINKSKNVGETLARVLSDEFVSLEERVHAASDCWDLMQKLQYNSTKRNDNGNNK